MKRDQWVEWACALMCVLIIAAMAIGLLVVATNPPAAGR